jgi:hypothetical protein
MLETAVIGVPDRGIDAVRGDRSEAVITAPDLR